MTAFIQKAYLEGARDALAGRDYANPYTPPEGSDETFDWKPALEENYHNGYGDHYKEATNG